MNILMWWNIDKVSWPSFWRMKGQVIPSVILEESEANNGNRLWHTYADDMLEPVEPILHSGKWLHVPVAHDKSIFHSNDLHFQVWVREGKMPLHNKGQGCAIHVSDFIVEHTGQLKLTATQIHDNVALSPEAQLTCTDAWEIIYRKNNEGWWIQWLIMQVCMFLNMSLDFSY